MEVGELFWAATVVHLREFVLKHTTVEEGFDWYLRHEMMETDRFHPYATDGALSEALRMMPVRKDYRNTAAVREYELRIHLLKEAVGECVDEMREHITDWILDSINHHPGYREPSKLEFTFTDDDVWKATVWIANYPTRTKKSNRSTPCLRFA